MVERGYRATNLRHSAHEICPRARLSSSSRICTVRNSRLAESSISNSVLRLLSRAVYPIRGILHKVTPGSASQEEMSWGGDNIPLARRGHCITGSRAFSLAYHTALIYNIHVVFDTDLELILNAIQPYNRVYIVIILSFEASRNGMSYELTIKAEFLRKL